ncbi:MAG: hypothetical protein ACLFU9_07900 [Candidatus Bathyarchaeia archaeon]
MPLSKIYNVCELLLHVKDTTTSTQIIMKTHLPKKLETHLRIANRNQSTTTNNIHPLTKFTFPQRKIYYPTS